MLKSNLIRAQHNMLELHNNQKKSNANANTNQVCISTQNSRYQSTYQHNLQNTKTGCVCKHNHKCCLPWLRTSRNTLQPKTATNQTKDTLQKVTLNCRHKATLVHKPFEARHFNIEDKAGVGCLQIVNVSVCGQPKLASPMLSTS